MCSILPYPNLPMLRSPCFICWSNMFSNRAKLLPIKHHLKTVGFDVSFFLTIMACKFFLLFVIYMLQSWHSFISYCIIKLSVPCTSSLTINQLVTLKSNMLDLFKIVTNMFSILLPFYLSHK